MSKFNDVSEAGYSRSSRGYAHSNDVMERGYGDKATSISDLFNFGVKPWSIGNDPVYGQKQDFADSLTKGNTRTQTLMSQISPDRSYEPPKVNADNLKRDANKAISDGSSVSQKANMAIEDTKRVADSFKQDWKQAKSEMLTALKDAAKNMEVSPEDAVKSLIPNNAATKMDALSYMLTGVFGGGSLAMLAVGGGSVVAELGKEDKKLPLEKQEALLEETLTILKSSSSSNGASANPTTANASVPMDAPKGSSFSWEDLEAGDLKEFMAADSEGNDQPEIKKLNDQMHNLEEVIDNHKYVGNNYNPKDVAPEKPDAGSVYLAGAALSDISVIKINANTPAVNDAEMDNVYDIAAMINDNEHKPEGNAHIYRPPEIYANPMIA